MMENPDRPDPARRRWLKLCAAGPAAALAGCSSLSQFPAGGGGRHGEPEEDDPEKIDDWQYDPEEQGGGIVIAPGGNRSVASDDHAYLEFDSAGVDTDESIGLAAGGAADVGTFRRNVYEGYLPIPEAMAYEGLFHEYYFDTGGDGSCSSLFCPTYTPAITDDPLSGTTEQYLSVGLDSGLAQSDFERPPLNLVLVLDISGSMSASFDEYYYDQFGNEQQVEAYTGRSKMDIAREVLVDLTHHLRPEDRLGVVLFNNESFVAKPVRAVEATDMDAIRGHIMEDVEAGGGTNISAAMEDAEELLDDVVADDAGSSEYEHRSILLTDAQINWGETDADELRSALQARAEKRMHTSVVGIGVDFNADLINQITAVRGANYYSVYSASQFEQRMLEEFEYMVTPLVYDLSLELDAEGYEISQVYGSTAADEATGELMHVNTLFPSPAEDGKAKGGVVLVQVERTGDATGTGMLDLEASWEERDGTVDSTVETVSFPDQGQHWGSDAIRKAVLLARHADLLKQWAVDERTQLDDEPRYDWDEDDDQEDGDNDRGPEIEPDDPIEPPELTLSEWELQSVPLTVSESNAERFETFREHFDTEADAIGDETLERELELLGEILQAD